MADTGSVRTAPLGDPPFPRVGAAWTVIAILWLVTIFSQLDRQLPALLVKPLKLQFHLTDTQFSLLQGYAFALVYTMMGLPFGRLIDRSNRRNLILCGVAVWSVMTVLAGFATSYAGLVLTRIGVGVGEAVLAPAAYSMIADYVAPARRGRALAVYYVALAVGSGASLLIGGLMLRHVPPGGVALAGRVMAPWQLMFVLAGLPGALLVLLLLAVREPPRRETGGMSRASVGAFVAHLRAHGGTFARLMTYPALLAVIGYGVLAWAPAYFDRRFGIAASQAGIVLGALVAVCGLAGTLLSGWLSDRWLARQRPAARFRVALTAWVVIVPATALWTLMPTPPLAYALLGAAFFGFAMAQSAAPPSIQDVVPNSMRGQAIALYLLIAGLLGIGLGPTSIALVTDHVFGNEKMLGSALMVVTVPVSLAGFLVCLTGQRPYARTVSALSLRDGASPA